MERKPEEKAVTEDDPEKGNNIPTAELGMRMDIQEGLKPIYAAVGIKILKKRVEEAVPEKRLVPTTVTPAARKGNPVIPMPKPPITPIVNSRNPNWLRASVRATAPVHRKMMFQGACSTTSRQTNVPSPF